MTIQKEIILPSMPEGFHLVTRLLEEQLPELPDKGLVNFFLMHTSAALTITENADPSVRVDLNNYFRNKVPEGEKYFTHTAEGPDDMPAHIKSALLGVSVTIPVRQGRLQLGTWQGICLCEFRKYGGKRIVTATIFGE
ncbi:MAG: secondary thiamine-phosphate synthase enzyme YjbQ [Bacteroidota bacterium]